MIATYKSMPDLHVTIEEMVAEGGKMMCRNIWRFIDQEHGFADGVDKVRTKRIVKNDDDEYVEGSKTVTINVPRRNRDKMMEVRRHYDDNRFVNEFMGEKLFVCLIDHGKFVMRIFRCASMAGKMF